MRHYLGIMMPPQESDDWSYDLFTRRLVAHMQSSDDWAQGIAVQRSLRINDFGIFINTEEISQRIITRRDL